MIFHHSNAECYVPDGVSEQEALQRVTHLGIGAHHDDLEFMALHGILQCYQHHENSWFGGVTCTDGAGCARTGAFAQFSNEAMQTVRANEQRAAAALGRYGAMIQLSHPSQSIKDKGAAELVDDLEKILRAAKPRIVYTHNLADKHETHLAVAAAALAAMRRLPRPERPQAVYGCEIWRGLDWMQDSDKVLLDVSGHQHLAAALAGAFESQIAGGKRYDLATAGRRAANATFLEPRATDQASEIIFAMDLTPLAHDENLDPVAYTLGFIDKFRQDVASRLAARCTAVS